MLASDQNLARLCLAPGLLGLALLLGCGGAAPEPKPAEAAADKTEKLAEPDPSATPLPTLDVEFLRRHIVALSDDAMEGRGPGTPGGKKAVDYISAQMAALGVAPAGVDGTWTQAVPMRAVSLEADKSSLSLLGPDGERSPLTMRTDIVAGRLGPAGKVELETPLVFVGYGVTAPEFGWDDYAGVDVKGKTVVVLVGDPPVDDERFGGKAMTYYGRWTYKFERALEAGAAGCLIVHETAPASYGWNVVESSWSGERFSLVEDSGAALQVQGWISSELADRLAKQQGQSLDTWHAHALTKPGTPLTLRSKLAATLTTTERTFTDGNVLGRIEGRTKPDEVVLLTGHWDHLGVEADAKPGQDAIFNGAVDNASGIAAILGVATELRQRASRGEGPGRSVVLLATTAEEQGLLGSRYYAAHPLTPAESIVGVVNLDSMNVLGPTTSIAVPGLGHTTLEDELRAVAQAQGRTLEGDRRPEAGSFYRSDHFSFAKQGIAAITFGGGSVFADTTSAQSETLRQPLKGHYHTVDDEFDPSWPLTGALQDTQAALELVLRVANAEQRPAWKPTSDLAPRG